MININLKNFICLYSCFFAYGIILSILGSTVPEILVFSLLFLISVTLLDYVNENAVTFKEKFISTFNDNAYVIVLGITVGYYDSDLLMTLLFGLVIVSLVALRVGVKETK